MGDQRKSVFQDIALLTGGNAITEGLDMQKNIQISDLGYAKKVTIGKNRTVIESRALHHQLRGSEPLKKAAAADLRRIGEREYSSSQGAI